VKLGITDCVRGEIHFTYFTYKILCLHANKDSICNLAELSCLAEMDLEHSSIHMAGVYLKLLIQFLENKVAIELTRAEFIEAQEVGYVPAVLIYLGSCCILCDP
jgi:hypothetical protein